MASKTQRKARGKGAGCIVKKKKQFYFRAREDKKEIYTLLRDFQGKPITERTKAEEAAALRTSILQAKSQEDIAEYVLESRKLTSPLIIPLNEVWETYLSQAPRPDSGEKTLRLYHGLWQLFLQWLREQKPEITHIMAGYESEGAGLHYSSDCKAVPVQPEWNPEGCDESDPLRNQSRHQYG